MSEVYTIEPKTNGKVIIYTSLGELEILLFSNECPLACEHFIQLCFNNYYNKNIFFRIIPNLLIHTGDHTNTGLFNDYKFNKPFICEFNKRLKFNYIGCLGFVKKDEKNNLNGTQFFITLNRFEYFNNLNTMFGKVAKHSIYNLLKFNNIKTNKYDEPVNDIPYIEYIQVIENPFNHIVPNIDYDKINNNSLINDTKNDTTNEIKNYKKLKKTLLSFNYEDEEEKKDGIEEKKNEIEEKKDKIEEKKNEIEEKKDKVEEKKNEIEEKKNEIEEKKNEIKEKKDKIEEKRDKIEEKTDIKEEKKVIKDEIEKEKKINNKEEKILLLKEVIHDINNSNNEKLKSLTNINEKQTFLENMKEYKKLSKKGREKRSLEKLKDFENRLINIINNTDKSQHEWLNKDGLKFNIDSNNAYEHEEIKNKIDSYVEKDYIHSCNVKDYLRKKKKEKKI